jgi:hypothetical protein
MKEAALKIDLYNKIEHANIEQLKELYGLVTNYFNGNQVIEELETLPEIQQKLINKGLEQANAGLGISLKELNKRLREKHGLNG